MDYGTEVGYRAISVSTNYRKETRNGWESVGGYGDRGFISGDWMKRASSAYKGLYGLNAEKAGYLCALRSSDGEALNGHYSYTLTFSPGGFPPAKSFWSITAYKKSDRMLAENRINRYVINSPMVESLLKVNLLLP